MNLLKFYKTDPEAHDPEFATEGSACFDLKAFIRDGDTVTYFTSQNVKMDVVVSGGGLNISPRERYLIPTGLIFDIPVGFSVRIHPRSGLSLKNGLGLSNMEGVIDYDYVEPSFILLENRSDSGFRLTNGMRICQGELVQTVKYEVVETENRPETKTDREGGFGSTGH